MDLGCIIDVATPFGVSEWTVTLWEQQRHVPAVRFIPGIIRLLEYDAIPADDIPAERLRAVRQRLGLTQKAWLSSLVWTRELSPTRSLECDD